MVFGGDVTTMRQIILPASRRLGHRELTSIMMANGMAVIATLFKGSDRGKALGINACLVAIGGMSGPAVGGFLINSFDWHAIFLPSVPIAVVGAILSYKLIPSYHKKKAFKFDYKGFFIFYSRFTCLAARYF